MTNDVGSRNTEADYTATS